MSIPTTSLSLPILFSAHPDLTRNQCQNQKNNRSLWLQDNNHKQQFEYIQNYLHTYGIKWTYDTLSDYHFKFNTIPSKPKIVYYRWDYALLNKSLLWVVWPRLPTSYGKKIVSEILERWQSCGFVTISWLADGIDSRCMSESIRNNIPTIAVLWWWIEYFMRTKKSVLEYIINHGWLILSEFKLGMKPTNYSFPQRNRLIAWLCDVLCIPEASSQSGSLITADFAIKMHKPVIWAPNNIYNEHSLGINKYIHERKINALYNIDQFLSTYFQKPLSNTISHNTETMLSPDEIKVCSIIHQSNWISIDQILSEVWLSIQDLMGILTLLELKNCIVQYRPNWYERW